MSKILAADDSILAQKSYRQMLEFLGHEVIICANGIEAVNAFREQKPDLVILDVDMPEMNGFDACREMRKIPDGLAIPIIMVSVEDSEEDITNGMNAGANDYLVKPVKEPHLIAKLKTFLKFSFIHKEDLDLVRNQVEFAGRYKIEKILGHGAHSVVFLAKDKETGNEVAVKVVTTPELETFAKSFIETAERIRKVDSKNILKIYDYGQYAGKFYIILEYADKGDLAAELRRHKLSEQEALKLGLDIAKGLKELDKHGIVHFDIKPENIMFAGSDYKLGDFGIIQQRESGTVPIKSEIWSTAAYLPPEYLNDSTAVSIRSDIYALGVTLYQAVTGENPFQSEKSALCMFKQMNLVPPSIKSFDPRITEYFSDTLDAMLDKKPENRPSVDEIMEFFSNILDYLAARNIAEYEPREEKLVKTSIKLKDELDKLAGTTWTVASKCKSRRKSQFYLSLLKFGITRSAITVFVILISSSLAGYLFYADFLDKHEVGQPG
ncbi:MAG: protein kinase, partial [Victivallales bacterium]